VQGLYVALYSLLAQIRVITSFFVQFVGNPVALSALNPYAENAVVHPFHEAIEFDIVLAFGADDVVALFHIKLHGELLFA